MKESNWNPKIRDFVNHSAKGLCAQTVSVIIVPKTAVTVTTPVMGGAQKEGKRWESELHCNLSAVMNSISFRFLEPQLLPFPLIFLLSIHVSLLQSLIFAFLLSTLSIQ